MDVTTKPHTLLSRSLALPAFIQSHIPFHPLCKEMINAPSPRYLKDYFILPFVEELFI